MQVTIDRNMWNRGEFGGIVSCLFDSEAKTHNRCCLGFVAEAAGIPDRILNNWGEPEEAYMNGISPLCTAQETFAKEFEDSGLLDFEDGLPYSSELTSRAIDINDTMLTTEVQREKELVELFKTHGHELLFIN